MNEWEVVVVGAGPAGLVAAERAATRRIKTLLLEKNRQPGVKILISGGGHCNVTHDTDAKGIVAAFGPSGRFLHSALASLGPQQLRELLQAEGIPTFADEEGKVWPASQDARDVLRVMLRRFERSGAMLATEEPLLEIHTHAFGFRLTTARQTIIAKKVVLTTGGCSYPGCGTSGDGYRLAAALGHTIVTPRPALVPILTDADWIAELQGITIPDAALRIVDQEYNTSSRTKNAKRNQPQDRWRGSLLFAHFGLSGPVALDASRAISACPRGKRPSLQCDFLPDIKEEQLETLLMDDAKGSGRQVASLLERWLPHRLAVALVEQAQLSPDRRAAELSRHECQRLVQAVKRLHLHTTGTLGFEKAEVTAGGVSLDEVDSHTMQSRLIPGLFLAGELLDLDGPIGGYNLQAAYSTGYLAGQSVCG